MKTTIGRIAILAVSVASANCANIVLPVADGAAGNCIPGQTVVCPGPVGAVCTATCQANRTYGGCTCTYGPDGGPIDHPVIPVDVRDIVEVSRYDVFDARTGPGYAPCTSNVQCGTGGRCLTVFPGGVCTRACTNDRACGSGVCVSGLGMCLPSCTPGALDCDQYGGACIPIDSTGTVNVCIWSCFPPTSAYRPAGFPNCAATMPCDPYSGACGQMASGSGMNGDPCMADADCLGGRCITEVDDTGNPTGFIGGYCLSFGRMAPISQGQPVPPSNCPPGAGVVPLAGEMEGDGAPCLKTCNSAADCRPGYQCDHLTPASGTGQFFSNGICLPVSCLDPGMTCPAEYHCVVTDAGTNWPQNGMCVR